MFFPLQITTWFSNTPQKTFSIMLDPAGDAKHTGRKLDDSFERGITLHCAEELKARLEKDHPTVRVVLTRFPGESSLPLQNAHFANRLQVNLYISIHFYHEQETKPHMYLYWFCNGDDFTCADTELFFYPFDKIYVVHQKTTNTWIKTIKEQLERPLYANQFTFHQPLKVPFKPLVGIKAPALAFEIGLKNKDDWTDYVDILADSLKPIINSHT